MAFTQRPARARRDSRPTEIEAILDTAASIKEISERDIKKVPTLRGKTVVNLFFEAEHPHPDVVRDRRETPVGRLHQRLRRRASASPRARRCSTPRATSRPCGPTRSSFATPSSGAPHLLARRVDCPIINAGDGCHEHPTQALLDCLTIRERRGRIAGLTVAIVGDLLHSRVGALERPRAARARRAGAPGRSADAAAARVRVAGRGTAHAPGRRRPRRRRRHDAAACNASGRARNFFPSLEEYSRYSASPRRRAPGAARRHHHAPGAASTAASRSPRDVADGPYSVIMEQVTNGVAVRMAVLYLLSRRSRSEEPVDADAAQAPASRSGGRA